MLISRSKYSAVILLCFLSISCANALVKVASIGDQIGKTAVKMQQDEISEYRAKGIDPQTHLENQQRFELIGRAIKVMNSSIRAGSIVGVSAAINELQVNITSLSASVSSSSRLQVWITIINSAIATMLALI